MRRKEKQLVGDCEGGEIVRTYAGLVRLLHRKDASQRWALLLREDLSETSDRIWLSSVTRITELVQDAAHRQSGGSDRGDSDPLLGGGR